MNIPRLTQYQKDIRPWGNFERFTLNEQTTVKLITVTKGEQLSLQTHEKREEYWRIISGVGVATVGDAQVPFVAGDDIFLPCGAKHRIGATESDVLFLEIAFGTFEESDIIRLDDRYGRT
jgi:mannose-6-phosphate isomerase-like protein (cupin superfamily)